MLTWRTHLRGACSAVLRLLQQLQGAQLPVFALSADLFAALQLQSQFSNLLEEKEHHVSERGVTVESWRKCICSHGTFPSSKMSEPRK